MVLGRVFPAIDGVPRRKLRFSAARGASGARLFSEGVRRPVLKEVILTPEGYEKLKREIEYLSNDKRREVAESIRIAREFGDIDDNAEYYDANNEQVRIEARKEKLEEH